jgi:uncharacterized membrane protein YgcG
MGRSLVVAALALTGLLCAAGIGFAAYLVSRDSVAVPVTQLEPRPRQSLTPRRVNRQTPTRATPTTPTTTVDDHGGRGRGGGGGDNSGPGGGSGGHGSDD